MNVLIIIDTVLVAGLVARSLWDDFRLAFMMKTVKLHDRLVARFVK